MMMTKKIRTRLQILLSGSVLLASCTTADYQSFDQTDESPLSASTTQFHRPLLAGEPVYPALGLEQFDWLGFARLAQNMDVAEVGERNFVRHTVAETKNLPFTKRHASVSADDEGKRDIWKKHLNSFNYDAVNYTSVAQELPSGWARVDGGILHHNSGLKCDTNWETEDENFKLTLTRLHVFDDKGLDVGCSFQANTGGVITLFATYAPSTSQQDHANAAAQDIVNRFGTTKTLSVPYMSIGDEAGNAYEEPSVIGFDVTPANSDVKLKSSLWVVKTNGGWHVKTRATHRQDDQATELAAVVMFAITHLQVRIKNVDAPADAIDV